MRHSVQFVVLLCLLVALLSAVHGMPSWFRWGPGANRGPIGGPAQNGGDDESTDNIILPSKGGKWRY